MILWRMVSKSDQTDPQIVLVLEFARLEDISTDGLDVLCCRCDVGSLAAGAVLDKDEVPERCKRVQREESV